jgi:hypothetical protein
MSIREALIHSMLIYEMKNMRNLVSWEIMVSLIPKEPSVPTGDKPVLGSVAWSHTIFRFFETFFQMRRGISFVWAQISWF